MSTGKNHQISNGFEREFNGFFKTLCYVITLCLLIFMIFIVLAFFRISSNAFDTYESLSEVPYNKVGLILGTSSLTSDGNKNPFFVNRIRAAVLLYKRGKIEYILVSGDNRHPSYNEPRQMMNALIHAGIPRDRIVADYAGFSTIDSVVRASKVFMLKDVTIISQGFHNERALFIAKHNNINAIGFNASDPASKLNHSIVYIREFFARLKCIFDVYFMNTQPTFLGDPIQIGDSPMPKEQSNKPKMATSRPKQPGLSAKALKVAAVAEQKPELVGKEQTDAAAFLRQKYRAREHLKQVVARDDVNYALPMPEPKRQVNTGLTAP